MKECGRKLIGLRATPLLANSPIRLARVFPLLQVFDYQTNRCHTSSYKERQNTFIGSRTFCHFTSLPAQSNSLSLSPNSLFHSPPTYLSSIPFSFQPMPFTPYPAQKTLQPLGTIHPSSNPFRSSKSLQTEKDNFGSEVL